jgi:hypothetical protein
MVVIGSLRYVGLENFEILLELLSADVAGKGI